MLSHFENDLDWFAYCYVSGELAADERQQFEELLANRQDAREAVARAVELIDLVRAGSPVDLSQLELGRTASSHPGTAADHGSWMKPLAWLSLATAASVAIFLNYLSRRQAEEIARRAPSPAVSSNSPDAAPLTMAWLESRMDLSDDDADAPLLAALDEVGVDAGLALERDDAEPAAPSWLTAAVTGVGSPDSEATSDE